MKSHTCQMSLSVLITIISPQTHKPQLADRTALPSRSLDSSAHRQEPGGGAAQTLPRVNDFQLLPGCHPRMSLCITHRGQPVPVCWGKERDQANIFRQERPCSVLIQNLGRRRVSESLWRGGCGKAWGDWRAGSMGSAAGLDS